ncbi:MAG: sigma 54-interacting transcriptional regulator [Candidatus Binatia bacterium]
MRIFSISVPLAAAIVDFVAVVVVLAGARDRHAGRAFALMTASFGAWHLLLVACSMPDTFGQYRTAFAISRFGQIIVPATAFHCALVWSGSRKRWALNALRLGYLMVVVLFLLHESGLLIDGFVTTPWGGIISKPALAYPAFVAYCLSWPAMAILLCIQGVRASGSADVKLRSRYWLLGATVAFPLGAVNILVNYGFPIVLPSGVGNIAMVAVVAYAIVRHRLMDIDVFIVRTAAVVVAGAAVVLPVAGTIYWLQHLPVGIISASILGFGLLATGPIMIAFSRFRAYVEREVESALFRGRHAAREAIRQVSAELVQLPLHADLPQRFAETLKEGLGLVGVALYLKRADEAYDLAYGCGGVVKPQMLGERPYAAADTAHAAPIEWQPRTPAAEAGGEWEACVPVCADGVELGFMALGMKRSGAMIDGFDVELLRLVAAQLAIGLKNAEYVGKIQRQQAQIEELRQRLEAENVVLRSEARAASQFGEIIGSSQALQRVLVLVEKVAPTDAPVLITGETGTGKELVARAVHDLSPRRAGPLIGVNCPAIPAELAESELFGHERGAFTGAVEARPGKFELADGGTIFLDEVADLPMAVQVKLLRVLQEHETQRLGSRTVRKLNLRVVAATNRDLHAEMRAHRFREDLYFRLARFPLSVPALRERVEDIPVLASYFLDRAAATYQRPIKGFAAEAMEVLRRYNWPGNIRELQNLVERAVLLCTSDVIRPEHLADLALAGGRSATFGEAMREEKWRRIDRALAQTGGNQAAAARLLGISPSNLARLMKSLGVKRPPVQ